MRTNGGEFADPKSENLRPNARGTEESVSRMRGSKYARSRGKNKEEPASLQQKTEERRSEPCSGKKVGSTEGVSPRKRAGDIDEMEIQNGCAETRSAKSLPRVKLRRQKREKSLERRKRVTGGSSAGTPLPEKRTQRKLSPAEGISKG